LALSVPLSRFTSLVGGGSAFFVRPLRTHEEITKHRGISWSRIGGAGYFPHTVGEYIPFRWFPEFVGWWKRDDLGRNFMRFEFFRLETESLSYD
jgi:hypothetical protein